MNNKGFPHNVVFDEDAIPAGVSVDALSHEDYLNGAGDSVTTKFDVAGTYGYYCEPHQGAGMVGKVRSARAGLVPSPLFTVLTPPALSFTHEDYRQLI